MQIINSKKNEREKTTAAATHEMEIKQKNPSEWKELFIHID